MSKGDLTFPVWSVRTVKSMGEIPEGPPGFHRSGGVRKLLDAVNEARRILRFIRELDNSDANVREQAANELGALGDPYALHPLLGALNDGDVEVRFAAVSAL